MEQIRRDNDRNETLAKYLSEIFAIPIALFTLVYNVITFVIGIILIPFKIAIYLITTFPILSVIFFLILCFIFWLVRRITRVNIVNYTLYTAIPYILSTLYTVLSLIFPQLNTVSTVVSALLHPIRWILGLVEKIDERAAPIRRTVEAMTDREDRPRRRSQRLASKSSIEAQKNEERIQCCVCMVREKSILLQPCRHLCLCEKCLKEVQKTNLCPICRTYIEDYINVFM